MMIERLRARLTGTALGPVTMVWTLGYGMIAVLAALLGRTGAVLSFMTDLPLLALGVALTMGIERLHRGLADRPLPVRWPALALALLAATFVQTFSDLLWLRWLSITAFPSWQAWAYAFTLQRTVTVFVLYLWTFSLMMTLIWAMGLQARAEANAARAARAEAEAERAEAEADEAEAEADRAEDAAERAEAKALRLQLDPHFLFNTLNSISCLVTLDRNAEANRMLDALGDFLRASLHSDPTADVTLDEEIDTIDAYLGIESIRFGDRLTIDIDIAPGLHDVAVPNFILQPLVENAVKHGVAATRGPATLTIAATRDGGALVLSVTNTRPAEAEAGEARPGTGIGLANIRQRLAIRYDEGARLETGPVENGWRAEIWLPAG
jgi:two-component system LytT family sensor kinase